MRPHYGIGQSARKEPAYRVSVRLICVVKAADHGREKNAKSELKISFPRKAHYHELCATQLSFDLQRVFRYSFVGIKARPHCGALSWPNMRFWAAMKASTAAVISTMVATS